MRYSKFIVMFIMAGILSAFTGQPAGSQKRNGQSEKNNQGVADRRFDHDGLFAGR